MKTLEEYVLLLKEKNLVTETNLMDLTLGVGHISFDSKDVGPGTLFVCKGAHFKEEYLKEALENGAFVYLSEKVHDVEGSHIIVNDVRKAMAYVADLFYDRIWENLKLVGITGTKGKSTTAYYLKYIFDDYLKALNKPNSAILSSIDNFDGVINEESHITTPETFILYKHFKNAADSGCGYLTMEVSSQGLKYDRTLGVRFDVGCFLNINEDHISDIEHSDFEDYISSKLRLFGQCKTACVNLESDEIDRVLAAAKASAPEIITFGLREEADVYGNSITVNQDSISFRVKTRNFDEEFKISMPGLFNVENALAAIAACTVLSIPVSHIRRGLAAAKVGGRMEVVRSPGRPVVIIDYAHNKMSFEALFASTKKEFPGWGIHIVFGCPGYKALGRRRELGEVAGRYAGKVYITEEDAGEEPLSDICREIATHVEKSGCDYEIIEDRLEAIGKAINSADEKTVILITGKGRETRQKRGIYYIETKSDVEYVEELIGVKI